MDVELTFCELRCKEVVNIVDGRRLGRIIDMVADARTGRLIGLVTPGVRRFLFKAMDDIFIPWCDIEKIGDDVILVKLGCRPPHGREEGGGRGRGRDEHRGGRGERDEEECEDGEFGDGRGGRGGHEGGRGGGECGRGREVCRHCGGRGCDRCSPGRHNNLRNDCGRLAADWVYHRFKTGEICGHGEGGGHEDRTCGRIDGREMRADAGTGGGDSESRYEIRRGTGRINNDNAGGYAQEGYYNRYDDRGATTEGPRGATTEGPRGATTEGPRGGERSRGGEGFIGGYGGYDDMPDTEY